MVETHEWLEATRNVKMPRRQSTAQWKLAGSAA